MPKFKINACIMLVVFSKAIKNSNHEQFYLEKKSSVEAILELVVQIGPGKMDMGNKNKWGTRNSGQ